MAYRIFFLYSLLLILAVTQGIHAVDYIITNKAANRPGGARFDDEIGVPYSQQTLENATSFIWKIFQQDSPIQRKNVQNITMFIDDMEVGNDAINNQIHVTASYIEGYSGDIKREITGILYHEITHIWQWDGKGHAPRGLIEGIAEYVRLKAGLAPSRDWVTFRHGDRWDQGCDVMARFLNYCDSLKVGFVAQLNKKMRNGYSDQFFDELLGKTVDQLWRDYQAK
ncbi:uncharacterized protein LOC132605209 [Lycium barbarum]|uniref:uncharacterized protein LOC132605209 n=1 Tax=Lycium barbarum TaxID=112863 RepID=UPI00293E7356|nr:uncharacterized protein LOC132605209 [Lycium barbarum]